MAQNTVELSTFENFLLVGATLDIMESHVFPRMCYSDATVLKFVSKATNVFVSQSIPTKIRQYDFSNSLSRMMWLFNQGYQIIPCPMISERTVMDGNIPLLEWLYHGNFLQGNVATCAAAQCGRLDIVMLLRTFGFGLCIHLYIDVFMAAAYGGQVHVLDWLFKCASEPDLILIQKIFRKAGYEGFQVVIDWLFSQKLESGTHIEAFHMEVFRGAALSGNLNLLKAHAAKINASPGIGKAYYDDICSDSKSFGFQLASTYGVLKAAAKGGHIPVLEWLQTLPNPIHLPSNIPTYLAFSNGHLNAAAWLEAHR
jgi:hypothetical protein